ncbi:hypothetical protein R7042_09895 [Vibrio sp. 1262-1]|uniref:lipopolysaccharide biosynthesis protein n=1 Tax=Vibrio sp. 1262-1 TaxID=3074548 RepID=UPI0029643C82|nr:hypothetical protein [Vibrio sp. 1262-1]MDW2402511.1 hypothetical protein [Vibrio sp. 1262-1]
MKLSVINLSLRVGMLGSKSLFVFIAAKFLDLAEFGVYSLVGATIAYAIYVLGLDFYTFTTRKLIGLEKGEAAEIIVEQVRFCFLSYFAFFVPLFGVFVFGFIPWDLTLVFFILLLSEFISQELTRILIALEKVVTASIVLFIRTSLWCYLLVLLFVLESETRSVEWILYSWLVSSLLSVIIAFRILKFVTWKDLIVQPIPYKWIINGVKIAFPMLLSTLAIRAVFTLDKYTVEYFGDLSVLGVYSVYIAVCNALLSFMDAAVIQFSYPKIVKYFNSNDKDAYSREMVKFSKSVLGFLSIITLALSGVSEYVFSYLGKEEYLVEIDILWWLIAAHVILIISYIPHYGLFAMKKDRFLMSSHFIGLVGFITLTFIFYDLAALERVTYALFGAMCTILFVKLLAFYSCYRRVELIFAK